MVYLWRKTTKKRPFENSLNRFKSDIMELQLNR